MSNKIAYCVMLLLLFFMLTPAMAEYPDCTECDLYPLGDPPGDGICDLSDARAFYHGNAGWGQPRVDPPGPYYRCDLNEDGVCDPADSAIFREAYLRGACRIGVVECDLVPDEPDPVIAQGGTLEFDLYLHNKTSDPQDVKVPANVTLPNSSKYPLAGYLFPLGGGDISLADSQERIDTLSLGIPTGAPLGKYKYNAYVGQSGEGLLDSCCLEFVVVEVDDDECVECTINDDCGPREYCKKAVGDCEGTGCCAPRPSLMDCERVPNTGVCGCDTKRYADACEAARKGVNVACEGPCPCP